MAPPTWHVLHGADEEVCDLRRLLRRASCGRVLAAALRCREEDDDWLPVTTVTTTKKKDYRSLQWMRGHRVDLQGTTTTRALHLRGRCRLLLLHGCYRYRSYHCRIHRPLLVIAPPCCEDDSEGMDRQMQVAVDEGVEEKDRRLEGEEEREPQHRRMLGELRRSFDSEGPRWFLSCVQNRPGCAVVHFRRTKNLT